MILLLVLPIAAACSSATAPTTASGTSSPAASSAGPWSYTTGFGQTVTLPARPKVIVTDVYSAAALWDYGVRPTGVYGWGLEEGSSPLAFGDADKTTMKVVGVGDQLDVEKLAALKPDLVIGFGNIKTDGAAWTWWSGGVAKQATAVAPFLGVKAVGLKVPEIIEEYRHLAAALGADPDSATIQQDQQAFQTASDTLAATAKQRKLRAIALDGDASELYVGGKGLPQLGLLNDLGAPTVGPPSKPTDDGEDWAELSWELVPDYPADVVFAYTGSAKEFPDISIYRSLPAVKAKQVMTWDNKMPFTYAQYATWLTQVNTVYTQATKLST